MLTGLRSSTWRVSWKRRRMRTCNWRLKKRYFCKIWEDLAIKARWELVKILLLSTNNRSLSLESRSRFWKELEKQALMTITLSIWWSTEDSTRTWKQDSNSSTRSWTGMSFQIALSIQEIIDMVVTDGIETQHMPTLTLSRKPMLKSISLTTSLPFLRCLKMFISQLSVHKSMMICTVDMTWPSNSSIQSW